VTIAHSEYADRPGEVFGVCPSCTGEGTNHNIGPAHWFACDRCRMRWLVGKDLFSAWLMENPAQHEANRKRLASYSIVEPLYEEERWS
jgi:hypothetical protein